MLRYRQLWDDLASNDSLAKLTDSEERLFWALWATQTITDDWGNFRWKPSKIYLGCIPDRKRWNAHRVATELDGLARKKMLVRYEADGKSYGHLLGFVERTIVGQKHRRTRHCPPCPQELCRETQSNDDARGGMPSNAGLVEERGGVLTNAEPCVPMQSCALSADNSSPSPSPSPSPTPKGGKERKKKESYSPDFKKFWKMHPSHPGESELLAWKAWKARLNEVGSTPVNRRTRTDALIKAVTNYAVYCKKAGKEGIHCLMASTFLGPNERYVPFLSGVPEVQPEPRRGDALAKALTEAYPGERAAALIALARCMPGGIEKNLDKEKLRLYLEALKGRKTADFLRAVELAKRELKFFPSIAELRKWSI